MRNLRRTNCTTSTSFPWSVLSLIIALILSNCEKLLGYRKKIMVSPKHTYPLDSDYPIDIAKMLTF